MKIVIDIPEEDYILAIKNDYRTIYGSPDSHIAEAIKEGVRLPKNHGRLIDADKLKYFCRNNYFCERKGENKCDECTYYAISKKRVNELLTAESEEEE